MWLGFVAGAALVAGQPATPPATPPTGPARPRPIGSPIEWFSDYPSDIADPVKVSTRVELTVSAAGGVVGCRVLDSSGLATLDSLTCRDLTSAARFRPARDAAGQPIAATVTLRKEWTPVAPSNGPDDGWKLADDQIGYTFLRLQTSQTDWFPIAFARLPAGHDYPYRVLIAWRKGDVGYESFDFNTTCDGSNDVSSRHGLHGWDMSDRNDQMWQGNTRVEIVSENDLMYTMACKYHGQGRTVVGIHAALEAMRTNYRVADQ